MSVVDQRVWLEAGRVRRLLARTLLILGGALTATVVGWLLCSGSASADVLPGSPAVPVRPATVLGAVSPSVTDVVTGKTDRLQSAPAHANATAKPATQHKAQGKAQAQAKAQAPTARSPKTQPTKTHPAAKAPKQTTKQASANQAVRNRAQADGVTPQLLSAAASLPKSRLVATPLSELRLPDAEASIAPLADAQLPTAGLTGDHLPGAPAALDKVVQQVHLAVAGFGARVTPAVAPATALVPLKISGIGSAPAATSEPVVAHPLARVTTARPVAVQAMAASDRLTQPTAIPAAALHRHLPMIDSHHTADGVDGIGAVDGADGTSSGDQPIDSGRRHMPALPPVQPLGSSDSCAHGAGGPTGGTGGSQVSFVHALGAALSACGAPSTPRLAVVPGKQPGTSPD